MGLLDATAFQRFRDGFAGTLLEPGEAAYDDARALFNAMIDRRPALIAQCASTADVVAAVRFGREAGLEIAVRGGGHGVAGRALCDDGLVIDLRRMNARRASIRAARVAVVGGGATMSNLDRATEPFGLATTGGRVSTTGVGGFVLGGGNGWLDRRMGLACDNLVAAEVVTADGRVLTASAEIASRALLGAAWRRRQLRGGHLADAAAASDRAGDGGAAALGAGGGGAGAARLPRLRRRRLRRRRRRLGVPDRAARGLRARGHAGQAGARHPARRRRARGRRPGDDRADARARAPGRDDRGDALRRAAVPARRPAGLPQLLVGRVSARAARRGDRRLRRLGRRR